jgi:hypothetical protein
VSPVGLKRLMVLIVCVATLLLSQLDPETALQFSEILADLDSPAENPSAQPLTQE